jgi:hypothetical protein
MSKTSLSTKVPQNLHSTVESYADEQGVSRSEAARQLLQQGAESWRAESPGETLMRQATAISVVLAMVSGLLLLLPGGPVWSLGGAIAGVSSTLIFGVMWLSVQTLSAGELL